MSFNLFPWGQVTILLGQISFISTGSRNLSGLSRQDQDLKPVAEMDASILSLEQPLLNAAQKLLY